MIDFPFPSADRRITFDAEGPRIDGFVLVSKTKAGFVPLDPAVLAARFPNSSDVRSLHEALLKITCHMNKGELGSAGIATAQLPRWLLRETCDADPVAKAAADDPDHPGWPAGAPDSQGGQFRPKDFGIDKKETRKRLASRRSFRSVARRILTAKRVLRLIGENAAAAVTEEIPGADVVLTGIAIQDDLALLEDLAAEVNDSEAAITAVKNGPRPLRDLMTTKAPKDFANYDELKKLDVLLRYISAADEGEQIHHIVEQCQIGGAITNRMVQSTENVVKIPRLIHEEINAIYAKRVELGGRYVSPREYLKGRPFDEQKEFGLEVLRAVGILQ